MIKKLEGKAGALITEISEEEAVLIEETRTRKYKKALDTLGARQDRIKMVQGLKRPLEKQNDQPTQKTGEPAKPTPVVEELESTLTHQEIEGYSAKYGLRWRQIFQLDAEFWSLITLESEEREKDAARRAGKFKDAIELPEVKREEGLGENRVDDDQQVTDEARAKRIGLNNDGPSISLKTFLRYSSSLADKFRDVNLRLIAAFGIDSSNENVRIEWDQYLSLKCFLELFTLENAELERLWLKALDPVGCSTLPVTEFQTFMERLARGAMSEGPTAVS